MIAAIFSFSKWRSQSITMIILLLVSSTLHAHAGEDHGTPAVAAFSDGVRAVTLEASTSTVELSGILEGDHLLVYLDHFADNKPIIDASVELEYADFKTVTMADAQGRYPLAAGPLSRPGKYELIFTISSPEVQELLIAELIIPELVLPPEPSGAPAMSSTSPMALAIIVGLGLVVAGLIIALVGRRRTVAQAGVGVLLLSMGSVFLPEQQVYAHAGEDHGAAATPVPQSLSPLGATLRRLPGGRVYATKPAQRMFDIRTTVAVVSQVPVSTELSGYVLPDPNASGLVQATQAGRIEAGGNKFPALGQTVKQGDIIAYLIPTVSNLDTVGLKSNVAEIDGEISLVTSRVKRLSSLSGSVSQKSIDEANAELASLQIRRNTLLNGLSRREELRAPVSGTISQSLIHAGQVVETGDTLVEIIDSQQLWAEARAYDTSLLNTIESAHALTLDNQPLQLRLLGMGSRLLDLALPIQFAIEEPLPPLAVGQPLKVFIETRVKHQGVVLPRRSLTRSSEGGDQIWLHESASQFRAVAVQWQALEQGNIVVTHGVDAGSRVVTQGASSLASAR
jgi:cobalt-zinc-cadmium efflux system membrane fusion protein